MPTPTYAALTLRFGSTGSGHVRLTLTTSGWPWLSPKSSTMRFGRTYRPPDE
ncbi:hypothetical protein DCC79_00725 [bacterium]|nr:hypothetical protein [Chloroflexi bacterium CFX6]RIL12635.1 MAG: hypothetical protein DCC79_00725 [bacterium]